MIRVLAALAITVPAVLIWTLGHFTAGLIVGGVALAVIWWCGYRAWRADRERRRRYRETVWQRRECQWLYQLPHPIEDRTRQ